MLNENSYRTDKSKQQILLHKFRFRRFRIRENMWWTPYRLKNEHSDDYDENLTVLCLHSEVEMSKQVKVFQPAQPGYRKVILSTNIAETSVTIDDIQYVIDCGKVNVLRYNSSSKSSAFQ